MAITDYKVSEAYSGRDISSLSDRPNEDGLSTAALKARFDQLGKEVIPNYNDLIDFLNTYLGQNDLDITASESAVEQLGIDLTALGVSIQDVLDAYNSGQLNGKSAYELAVEGGYVGTEAEWILSLKGADGDTGSNFTILGLYATLFDLQTAHPTGQAGDAWSVGTALENEIYIWDTNLEAWTSVGSFAPPTQASEMTITDVGTYYTSEDVEGALQEVGAKLSPISSKATPVDADTMLIADSQASNVFKKLSWSNIKDTLKTYFDTLYNNYVHPVTHPASIIEQDASNRFVTDTEKATWNAKQNALVSGTNIKTINSTSLLGSGNLALATYTVYTATIPSASWTGSSAPYSKAVTVTGLLSTDEPIIDLVLTGTYATDVTMRENWSKIYRGVTSADSITFYADEVPTADISVQLVVVR